MTQADKRERRDVKHKLLAAVFAHHFSRDYKLCHTVAQQRADSRIVADQLLAGRNPHTAELLLPKRKDDV